MSNIDTSDLEYLGKDAIASEERQTDWEIEDLGNKEKSGSATNILTDLLKYRHPGCEPQDPEFDATISYGYRYMLSELLDVLVDDPRFAALEGDPILRRTQAAKILTNAFQEIVKNDEEDATLIAERFLCKLNMQGSILLADNPFSDNKVAKALVNETYTTLKFIDTLINHHLNLPQELSRSSFKTLLEIWKKADYHAKPEIDERLRRYLTQSVTDNNIDLFEGYIEDFYTFIKRLNTEEKKDIETSREMTHLLYKIFTLAAVAKIPFDRKLEIRKQAFEFLTNGLQNEEDIYSKYKYLYTLDRIASPEEELDRRLVPQKEKILLTLLSISSGITKKMKDQTFHSDDELRLFREAYSLMGGILKQYVKKYERNKEEKPNKRIQTVYNRTLVNYLTGLTCKDIEIQDRTFQSLREIINYYDLVAHPYHPFRNNGLAFYRNYDPLGKTWIKV
ncbi:MAG: hypothetical protein AB9915_02915 [Candidatus Dojkabacteria bacterium]